MAAEDRTPGRAHALKIWVDADACPKEVREIVFRASERLQVPVTLVANTPVGTPPSRLIELVLVDGGPDAADAFIADGAGAGDIVITADVPLAAKAVEAGAYAIGPRGRVYDESNVGERLATRNLLSGLREEGVVSGGPAPYSETHKRRFANALDRLLTKAIGNNP